jgi:O-antigen/teichoic acid export membrane protein
MPENKSILFRSIFSLFSTTTKSALVFLTSIILARNFGPELYGTYAFLIASFIAIKSFTDLGTSNAFFTFASKRNRSKTFYFSYFIWMFFQFLFVLVIISLLPKIWIEKIWHGENYYRIILAFGAIFLQHHLWVIILNLGETQRLTVHVQLINLAIALVHVVALLLMSIFGKITIENIFILVIVEYSIVALLTICTLPLEFSNDQEPLKLILSDYLIYCYPFIPLLIFNVISDFLDTWILVNFGGSVEQSYYSIGFQFSAVALIASTSFIRVFWKEISEANAKQNVKLVEKLVTRYFKIVFVVACIIASLLMPWSEEIILFTVGEKFVEGKVAFMIMMALPIHQSINQLLSIIYYALEHIKAYVIINCVFYILSIITIYFLIAPKDNFFPGLELGSIGLSLKMVFINFVIFNVLNFWITKKYNFNFDIIFQLSIMSMFIILGFSVYFLINLYFPFNSILGKFMVNSIIYLIVCFLIIYKNQNLLGLDNSELSIIMSNFREKYLKI